MALLLCATVLAAANEREDPYGGIVQYRLANGMEVYLLGDGKAENTRIEVDVNVGREIEDASTDGLTHLVEHIVFRDRRVPYRDYLDYLEEEGATYVNGMTGRFRTRYLATIDSNRSYWITEQFARMLFDKNVSAEDLEVERGALQTEIGEYNLLKRLTWGFFMFVRDASPAEDDIYTDEFGLDARRTPPAPYHAQRNNTRFTFEEVMTHYDRYYYPANMTLKIAGNFDTDAMKAVVEKSFGAYTKRGEATVRRPDYAPRLNHRPVSRFYDGAGENVGVLGAKYIRDDYRNALILAAYMESAASRLQRHLRNDRGQNYGVSLYMDDDRKAGIAGVYFDGLHEHFDENVAFVETFLSGDAVSLDADTIAAALTDYKRTYFASQEHDSESLMNRIDEMQELRRDYGISDATPFALFNTISHEEFRNVVVDALKPENRYTAVWREYYFFPFDIVLISVLLTVLFVLAIFKTYRIDYGRLGLRYTRRDVRFERRLSNRFIAFWIIVAVLFATSLAWEWIKYVLMLLLTGDPHYLATIDVPYSYPVMVLDALLFILFFTVVYKYGVRYYARLDVTEEALYLVGNNILVVEKARIASVGVVPWRPNLLFRAKGAVFLFWKPLVAVTFKEGGTLYLRAKNAEHLAEDIAKGLAIA